MFNLTFDYDFRRMPRDLSDTQIRIDYSNENTYWNTIVDKAANSKKRSLKRSVKRSLKDIGGSHKCWLEEEWRKDLHEGALSKDDLHKRVTNKIELKHSYKEDFILSIIDQDFIYPNVDGKLEVYAEMSVEADVNYGFTLIGKLGGSYGIDISDSYLYYRTGSNVDSKFVIDAAVTAHFDTGDMLMFSADTFGAAFMVPGIVTIGPNFKLYRQLEGKVTLGVNFETKVKLAEWDEPDVFDPSARSAKQTLEPEFEYSVSFTSLDSYAVNLVADGHVTFHAEAKAGSSGNSFCYGIDVGVDLYATLEAPKMFSWALPKSPLHDHAGPGRDHLPEWPQRSLRCSR
ncbi:hypothetical protein FALCPG4_003095 [Fusarium falciforme]